MRTGFIGLGAMGRHMARNLHKAGHLAAVWNRSPGAAEELARETGCAVARDPGDLASRCEVIVLCVSADAGVLQVIAALEPARAPHTLVIYSSTVSAATARTAAERLRARQVDFLDAPVSGGVEGARAGTLVFMVGGEQSAFERSRPVLEAMGKTLSYFGPNGAGQAAKATNQILCAGAIQAVAEAMAFPQAGGLPLDRGLGPLGQGAGSSRHLVNRPPTVRR